MNKEELKRNAELEELQTKLSVIQGGSKSAFWKEIVDVLDATIERAHEGMDTADLSKINAIAELRGYITALKRLKNLPKQMEATLLGSISAISPGGERDLNFINRPSGVKQKEM